ncbi:MAG: DNA polymerase III subunit alpha [Defluviitaleaceae bacterium]|nr:DNA polymerase III subunit alpha [Defluviitaleaceae bacterium]
MQNFTHLHVHTEYSLLDGSAKIKELTAKAAEMGMEAMAITDHGNMFGVIDFYKAAKKAGIKPILGCEVYVAVRSRLDRGSRQDDGYYHLVLLAENNLGYQNLMKLVSLGYTEGFYYKPRIDLELLRRYNEGLICLSACLSGPVARNVLRVGYERGKQEAEIYKEIFGKKRFFLELQNHGMPEQKAVNEALVQMAHELDLELVATNDIHYLEKDDAKAHEVLLCIQTGKTMLDTDRMSYKGDQYYLKTAEEMCIAFKDLPQALENTMHIARRCNVEIDFEGHKLPRYNCPNGFTAGEYLRKITYEGLAYRYAELTEAITARADFELNTILSMGFCDYFLVVWDFIAFAQKNGIAVGPGRGTSAASIVAYALKITNVDPLKFNLLFERFLNPERISMPDIDIDFCVERRQEVIDYVVGKYGQDHVAQIITFGTMGAKAVVRDVGRGLGMPYSEVDAIAKMIPFSLGITLDKALERDAALRQEYETNQRAKDLIDMARRLEGLPRHASTHAAGVVISDAPLTHYLPLHASDGVVTTQFSMGVLEELGLLKMDFLGLRTLTVIKHAMDEVYRRHGVKLSPETMDMEDKRVFETISAGRTDGMFQLESRGMTQFMKELKPSSIADLTAGISLFRPGPMDFIPKYIKAKNGGSVTYTHPRLEPILRETYGCIVYQEQVMQIVRDLAGYSMARADLIRRAMSKKEEAVMAREKQFFVHGIPGEVAGCIANGIPENIAREIWDEMADFAKYAFNKAHAVAYATIGYQTGWLKIYYPAEFMAALLTSVMYNLDNVAAYINECKRMDIKVLPPDVNHSFGHFTVAGDGQISFGMNAIKNLGRPTVAALTQSREKHGAFKSLTDFLTRLPDGEINKRSLEALIKAGAFSGFGGRRSQYMAVHESLINAVNTNRRFNMSGQISLMDMSSQSDTDAFADQLPDLPEFSTEKLLADEKEVLGIYVSGHPILAYEDQMKPHITAYSRDFMQGDEGSHEDEEQEQTLHDGQRVVVGGLITHKKVTYTRKNATAMCFMTIEDIYGYLEVIVFPAAFATLAGQLHEGRAVIIEGKVSAREEQASSVICENLRFLEKGLETTKGTKYTKTLWLKIPEESTVLPEDLLETMSRYGGTTPVVIYDEKAGKPLRVLPQHWINADNFTLINQLRQLLGERHVILK